MTMCSSALAWMVILIIELKFEAIDKKNGDRKNAKLVWSDEAGTPATL